MIDLLRVATRREFRSFVHLRFLLVLLPVLAFASGAHAQFSMEGGRGERMERGGGMRDGAAIGVGIGIGIELGKAAAEQDAREKAKKGSSTTTISTGGPTQRAARKDNKPGKDKKGDAKKNKEDDPPTTVAKDGDGIDVPGGKVRRGTGTVTGYKGGPRPGIYCWVHITDKKQCEKTAQYQFVTINFEAKWGDGAKANINDVVKKVRANNGNALPTTENGVSPIPGQPTGDDYNSTRHEDPVNLLDDDGKKVTTPPPANKEIKAGAYKPQKIPGGDGDTGLIDAPHWSDTISALSGELVPANLKQPKKAATAPPPSIAGEITVLQHFRTYVYCIKPTRSCLGYFDWDYNETITIEMKWKEATKKDLGDSTLGGLPDPPENKNKKKDKNQPEPPPDKTWIPYFEAKGGPKVDGPTIGEWKPCP